MNFSAASSPEKKKIQADPLGISSGVAASMLSTALGDSELVWLKRLANWRRPGRRHPIGWIERESGHPTYDFEEVRQFIEGELAQKPATARSVTEPEHATATAVADGAGQIFFVRVAWSAGRAQGTFTLSPDAALGLAKTLGKAAQQTAAIKKESSK